MGEIQIPTRTWAGEPGAPSVLEARQRGAQAEFSDVLARARATDGTPNSRARKAAEDLVSTALIGPVFKSMRESDHAAAPFRPNAAERSFGQMLDTTLAQRMVSSAHWPLVESVARHLLRNTAAPGKAGPTPGTLQEFLDQVAPR